MKAKVKVDCAVYGLSIPFIVAGTMVEVEPYSIYEDVKPDDYYRDVNDGLIYPKDLLDFEVLNKKDFSCGKIF